MITDLILLSISVWLFLFGFLRGFWRSLFGPIGMIVGSWLAILYYQSTKDIFISLAIGLFGPPIISLLLNLFILPLLKSGDPKQEPNIFSRASGACLTFIWGWFFIILTIIGIDIIPLEQKNIRDVQINIRQSSGYRLIIEPIKHLIIPPPKNKSLNDTATLQDLAQDPRFQQIFEDPAIRTAIEQKDYKALLSNPKIMQLTQEIANDPELFRKIMATYSQMQQSP